MIKLKAAKKLWNYWLEFESYICSNTKQYINQIDGDVPKTAMSSETSEMETGWGSSGDSKWGSS